MTELNTYQKSSRVNVKFTSEKGVEWVYVENLNGETLLNVRKSAKGWAKIITEFCAIERLEFGDKVSRDHSFKERDR